MPDHMITHIDIFVCPVCKSDLEIKDQSVICQGCNKIFPIQNGVPQLFTAHDKNENDVTETIKSFYEKTPFPNYEEMESASDLIQKAEAGVFAKLLNNQMAINTRVLEVGCGTGQVSNFLSIPHRFVFGVDMCLNSLLLGQKFKRENNLARVGFYQMNLFRPIFKPESFDYVMCNGVLHHTSDPKEGFKSIAKLVKPGGYILIGLYNKYSRIIIDLRRQIFKIFNNRFKFIDPRLRNTKVGDVRKLIWFQDQYQNPHESKHTIDEVLIWFKDEKFEFVNSIPKIKPFEKFAKDEKLFREKDVGSKFEHLLAQILSIKINDKEGGFFIMIGKKK